MGKSVPESNTRLRRLSKYTRPLKLAVLAVAPVTTLNVEVVLAAFVSLEAVAVAVPEINVRVCL